MLAGKLAAYKEEALIFSERRDKAVSIPSIGSITPSYNSGTNSARAVQTTAQNAQGNMNQAATNMGAQSQSTTLAQGTPFSANSTVAGMIASSLQNAQNTSEAAAGKPGNLTSGNQVSSTANTQPGTLRLDTSELTGNAWQGLSAQGQKAATNNGSMNRMLQAFTQSALGGNSTAGTANATGSLQGMTAGQISAATAQSTITGQATAASLGSMSQNPSVTSGTGTGNLAAMTDGKAASQTPGTALSAAATAASIAQNAKAATSAATNASANAASASSSGSATASAANSAVNQPAAGAATLRAEGAQNASTANPASAGGAAAGTTNTPGAPLASTAMGQSPAVLHPESTAKQIQASQQAAMQAEQSVTEAGNKSTTRQAGTSPRTQGAGPDASMIAGVPTPFTPQDPAPKSGELGLNIVASSDPVVMSQIAAASGFGAKLQQTLNLNLGIPGLTPASMVSVLGVLIIALVVMRVFVNGFADDVVILSFATIIGIMLTAAPWVLKPKGRK